MTATSMSSSTTSTTATSSRQLLLLKKEVFTIYLEPLLKLHEGKQCITYEDLTSSWQAAVAAWGKSTLDAAGKTSVRSQLTSLHQSQMQAYRVAATAALMEWANTVVLPKVTSEMTKLEQYVQHCRTTVTRPAWRDGGAPDRARLEERAKEAYAQFQKGLTEEEGEDGEIEEETADVVLPNEEEEGVINEDVLVEASTETKVNSSKASQRSKPAFVKKTTKPKVNPPTPPPPRNLRGRGRGGSSRGRGVNGRP